jgi:DNA modification methylase
MKLKLEYVPISKLEKWADNPRIMPDDQAKALRENIKRFGLVDPIIINKSNTIIGGHQRLDAALALGLKQVPVVRVDVKGRDLKTLNLALNRISGEWDAEKLAPIFEPSEIDKLIREVMPGEDNREDLIPATPPEPTTKTGDLWQLGKHRILCGDSTKAETWQRLLQGAKMAVAMTDPPYGVSWSKKVLFEGNRIIHSGANDPRPDVAGDKDTTVALATYPFIFQNLADNGVAYFFVGTTLLLDTMSWLKENSIYYPPWLVWVKTHIIPTWHHYKYTYESIVYCGPGAKPTGANKRWFGGTSEIGVWEANVPLGKEREHQTQKPVALYERAFLNSSAKNETVCDPFLGSGTAVIAAEKLGRVCYGIEIEPRYVDVAVHRWENYTGKQAAKAN